MSGAIDEQCLTFARFVDRVNPKCIPMASLSFVNPQETYRVMLVSKVKIGEEYVQSFDEHYLQPIAQELGLSLKKTAKLVALRNAWIAYFRNSEIPLALVKETQSLTTNEIVRDYLVLTSHKWTEHPRVRTSPYVFLSHEDCVTVAEDWDSHNWSQWYRDEEGSIWWCINEARIQRGKRTYSSVLERDADYATIDIKQAKIKIQELHAAIKEQEAIISIAKRATKKFQNSKSAAKSAPPGHPKLSDPQDIQRREWALNFVSQWVESLMTILSLDSYGELSREVCGQKMTWCRWLNKKMLPAGDSLRSMLDVKIKSGEHQNTKLRDIQTSPSLTDLITLVDLV